MSAQTQPLIDADVDEVMSHDYFSMIADPDDAENTVRRAIDRCAAIEAANSQT